MLVNFCPLSTTASAQLKVPHFIPRGGVRVKKRGCNIDYNVSSSNLLNDWVEEPGGTIFDSKSWPRAKHFPVLNIMWKINKVIVLLQIFFKQSAKGNASLWVCKSLRAPHGRGAWKLGRLWTPHDNTTYDLVDVRKQWLMYINRELLWQYKRLNLHKLKNYFQITHSITMEFYTQQNKATKNWLTLLISSINNTPGSYSIDITFRSVLDAW